MLCSSPPNQRASFTRQEITKNTETNNKPTSHDKLSKDCYCHGVCSSLQGIETTILVETVKNISSLNLGKQDDSRNKKKTFQYFPWFKCYIFPVSIYSAAWLPFTTFPFYTSKLEAVECLSANTSMQRPVSLNTDRQYLVVLDERNKTATTLLQDNDCYKTSMFSS